MVRICCRVVHEMQTSGLQGHGSSLWVSGSGGCPSRFAPSGLLREMRRCMSPTPTRQGLLAFVLPVQETPNSKMPASVSSKRTAENRDFMMISFEEWS
ncbi:unnamed protein product [Symbiodinium microadriaticum]|nr:unnamed protein product [Symbiodinium microadriaticum]